MERLNGWGKGSYMTGHLRQEPRVHIEGVRVQNSQWPSRIHRMGVARNYSTYANRIAEGTNSLDVFDFFSVRPDHTYCGPDFFAELIRKCV